MDSPDLDEARHQHALDALGRINAISRAAAQLWGEIRRDALQQTRPRINVLDLACGGGDVALSLEQLARRHGARVAVSGCDASPLAVARATKRARAAGSRARFFQLDALRDRLPADVDIICSTLFLHHLDEDDAVGLLQRMAAAARRMFVVQDLVRSRTGFALAHAGVRLLSRSEVARVDGPRSVRAAYTPREAEALARRAGLEARARRCFPCRFNLVWRAA